MRKSLETQAGPVDIATPPVRRLLLQRPQGRRDEHKWETTLKYEHRFNVDTLDDALFDITYGAREDGQSVDNSLLSPLPYAMVVTVAAEDTPGVYNNIRQRY